MEAAALVRDFLEAFERDEPMAVFADDFTLAGEGTGAPVLVFGVPGATAAELSARGMAVSVADVAEGPDDHVVVWGTWAQDGTEPEAFHVVLRLQRGAFAEVRFFDEIEQAMWFAGL